MCSSVVQVRLRFARRMLRHGVRSVTRSLAVVCNSNRLVAIATPVPGRNLRQRATVRYERASDVTKRNLSLTVKGPCCASMLFRGLFNGSQIAPSKGERESLSGRSFHGFARDGYVAFLNSLVCRLPSSRRCRCLRAPTPPVRRSLLNDGIRSH